MPFYIHQVVELPEIRLNVTHFRLFEARCQGCGSTVKGRIPDGEGTGYGPRLSALVAQLSGVYGESRETVQDLIQSVLGLHISTGGIQRIIDRASAAIEPVYEAIADEARNAPVNHVDETSWKTESKLKWLWVMANLRVAFFMIHKNRSYEAFCQLVDAWEGILVSDDYALYRKWVHLRQACLAHLLRHAEWLAQRTDPELAHFGEQVHKELTRLIRWAHEEPTRGEWSAFNARFHRVLKRHKDRKDDSGVFARRLINEMVSLWLFLSEPGVEPTNNVAERALRYPVTYRKRSLGTQSEKGDRWVVRIFSLRPACRLRGIPAYPQLVQAISDYLKAQPTDVAWVADLG
ncbi:MAG: IS66 family transposase [Desulfatibacillaceae bacterium]